MTEIMYRYDIVRYSHGVDQFDDPLPGYDLQVVCYEYRIIRRTPKGVWIDRGFELCKFVLLSATKQWACETKELAAESFRRRKLRQIKILRAQITDAERAISMLPNILTR